MALLVTVYMDYIGGRDTELGPVGAAALLWLLLWMTVVLGVVALIRWLLEQRWERAFLTTKAFLVALLGTLVHMGFLGVYGFFSAEYKYLSHGERLALGLPFVFLVLLTGLLGVVAVIRWLLHAAFKR